MNWRRVAGVGVVVVAAIGVVRVMRPEPVSGAALPTRIASAPAALTEPAAASEPMSGKVIDEAGLPVAGASVRLFLEAQVPDAGECGETPEEKWACSDTERTRQVIAALAAGTFAPAPISIATTDDAGTFAFDAAPVNGAVFVARGRGLGGTGTSADRAIVLSSPLPFRSSLIDEEGHVVEGARAWVITTFEATKLHPDEHGELSFPTFGAGRLYADAPGFEAVSARADSSVIILRRNRTLRVHVRSGGRAVDAEVRLAGQGPERVLYAREGEAIVDGLSTEAIAVSAFAPGLAALSRSIELAKPETDLTVELLKSSTIQFTVIDEHGAPVPDVKVALSRRLRHDDDGRWVSAKLADLPLVALVRDPVGGQLPRIGPLPEGEYVVFVSADGFDPVERPLNLRPGEQSMEFALERQDELALTVVGPNGPVANVLVTSWDAVSRRTDSTGVARFPWSKHWNREWYEAFDDELGHGTVEVTSPGQATLRLEPQQGRLDVELSDSSPINLTEALVSCLRVRHLNFAFSDRRRHAVAHLVGLPIDGTPCLLLIQSPHREAIDRSLTLSSSEVVVERFALVPDATIEGKVVDTQGQARVGAAVFAKGDSAHLHQCTQVTDGQGHFSLGGFHVGERIQLSATGGDVTWAVAPATDVLIKPPAAHVDGASLIVVDGRVVDADGAPMASASIWGCKWDDQPTLTDSEGRFRLEGVDGKECRTVYARRGASVGSGEVRPGMPLTIALRRPTHVTGVVSMKGRPAKFEAVWARERVSLADTSTTFPDATTDDEGRYELDLPPGEWTFSARGCDQGTTAFIKGLSQRVDFGDSVGRCSVRFVGGRAGDAELVPLEGGNSITFTYSNTEARPVPCGDYRVLFFGKEPRGGLTVHVTADATVMVPSLPDEVE